MERRHLYIGKGNKYCLGGGSHNVVQGISCLWLKDSWKDFIEEVGSLGGWAFLNAQDWTCGYWRKGKKDTTGSGTCLSKGMGGKRGHAVLEKQQAVTFSTNWKLHRSSTKGYKCEISKGNEEFSGDWDLQGIWNDRGAYQSRTELRAFMGKGPRTEEHLGRNSKCIFFKKKDLKMEDSEPVEWPRKWRFSGSTGKGRSFAKCWLELPQLVINHHQWSDQSCAMNWT